MFRHVLHVRSDEKIAMRQFLCKYRAGKNIPLDVGKDPLFSRPARQTKFFMVT